MYQQGVNYEGERYTKEFKISAVKQITQEGKKLAEVAQRLGITTKSFYNWKARYGENAVDYEVGHAKRTNFGN